MLYIEFIQKAVDLTIIESDNSLFYLEPLWKNILIDNKMDIKDISDNKCKWEDIENVLKLEVAKQNTIYSKKSLVIDWIYNIISSQIEPAMLSDETDLVKELIEYRKAKQNKEV